MFNKKQDDPLSPKTKTLLEKIREIDGKTDKDKNLFFAVRYDESYHNEYLAIKEKLPKLLSDDMNFYAIRQLTQGIDSYIKYIGEDVRELLKEENGEKVKIRRRSALVYLTRDQSEIDSLLPVAEKAEVISFVVG